MAFITSNTQPPSGALGDEWYNPLTNKIYKLVPLNGTTASWVEYNIPAFNGVNYLYANAPYTAPPTPPAISPLSSVRFLAIAGGGGGGGNAGSGGGAGGVLTSNTLSISSGTPYAITVGGGGAASPGGDPTSATTGTPTTIIGGALTLTAFGGGAGRGAIAGYNAPVHGGGSGGGAPGESTTVGVGSGFPSPAALFYTPTGAQGYPGVAGAGSGASRSGGGGGGAGGVGEPAPGGGYSPAGGIGINLDIEGSPKYYAGGGGGGSHINSGPTAGGLGGGGNGANGPSTTAGTAGTAFSGGGGGTGSGYSGAGAAGGSGVVIFSHPILYANATVTGSNVILSNTSGNLIYKFSSPGTIIFTSSLR